MKSEPLFEQSLEQLPQRSVSAGARAEIEETRSSTSIVHSLPEQEEKLNSGINKCSWLAFHEALVRLNSSLLTCIPLSYNILLLSRYTYGCCTGAWGDNLEEQLQFETIDSSRSHPNLRTIPLILTPLPDNRPQSATPILRRKNKVVPGVSVSEDAVSTSSRAVSPGKLGALSHFHKISFNEQ